VYTRVRGFDLGRRFATALAVAAALALAGCRCGEAKEQGAGTAAEAGKGAALDPASLPDRTVTCPVCGLTFNAKESVATRVYGGKTYYFLLEDHARAFAENPGAYLKK
jgi:YHS domain-containing protein